MSQEIITLRCPIHGCSFEIHGENDWATSILKKHLEKEHTQRTIDEYNRVINHV
jgi:hypothetical protein